MALKESVVEGDQIVTGHSTETRIFLTASPGLSDNSQPMRNTEVIESKTEVWYALTYTAAETERAANVQPEDTDAKYSYAISRVNNTGAYTLTRTFTKTTRESVIDSEPTSAPTFSPAAGTYTAASPLSVTLGCADDDAWIFYEIAGEDGTPPDPTTGSPHVPANTDIEVQLVAGETTTIKAFALKLGELVSSIGSVAYIGEVV